MTNIAMIIAVCLSTISIIALSVSMFCAVYNDFILVSLLNDVAKRKGSC